MARLLHTGQARATNRRGSAATTNEPGCDKGRDTIDQPVLKGAAQQAASPLQEEVHNPSVGQQMQGSHQIHPPGPVGWYLYDLDTALSQAVALLWRTGLTDNHTCPGSLGLLEQLKMGSQFSPGCNDKAQGVGTRCPLILALFLCQADGQARIIYASRPGPDHNGINAVAHLVNPHAGNRPANPVGVSRPTRQLAIQSHRPLGGDIGPSLRYICRERTHKVRRLLAGNACNDLDTCGL
jgi:hypothetical protein